MEVPAALPLLHAAESLVTVTTVDRWLMLGGATALGVVLSFIWGPPAARFASRRGNRRRLAGIALAATVFLAALPSVFPYDHVLPQPGHADDHASVHASHCHDQPGTCADAPITSGPGQMISGQPLLPAPALLSLLLILSVPLLAGVTRRPEVPPPLRAV